MTREELETYCKENGIPTVQVGDRLRVMDTTQLPMHMREAFDERGFLQSEPVETVPEVTEVEEAKVTEETVETEEAEQVSETEDVEEAPVRTKAKTKKVAKKK